MGSGKSSVGRLVAGALHFDFVDTDAMIEQSTGKKISDIFAGEGEAAFRQMERKTVENLESARNTVIATGGGLPINPVNLESLKSHALVVCLWASPEVIWKRVKRHSHRPLLQAPDPQERIRELLAAREPFYKNADVLVNTDSRTLQEIVQTVLHHFNSAQTPGA